MIKYFPRAMCRGLRRVIKSHGSARIPIARLLAMSAVWVVAAYVAAPAGLSHYSAVASTQAAEPASSSPSSPSWSIRAGYSAPVAGFYDIACPTTSICFAVGAAQDGSSVGIAIYSTTDGGTSWQDVQVPNISGALSAISCTSVTFCMAVGAIENADSATLIPLILSWNGTSWTEDAVAVTQGELGGVSCTSVTFCMAVGYNQNATTGVYTAIDVIWNDTGWKQITVPSAANAPDAVTCVSSSFCMVSAADQNASTGNSSPVLILYNGTGWITQTLPPTVGEVLGMACLSTSNCILAAYDNNTSTAVVVSYNGTSWSDDNIPSVAGQIISISCASATFCIAVGANQNANTQSSTPIMLVMNAASWTNDTLPPQVGYLDGVACTSSSNCLAVGSDQSGSSGVIVSYSSGTRTLDSLPLLPSGFSGISCSSAIACVAIGDYETAATGGQDTMDSVYNGTSWTLGYPASLPAGLSHISCASATFCMAVGTVTNQSTGSKSPVSASYDGSAWTAHSLPLATGDLTAVSCISGTFCIVVGYQSSSPNGFPSYTPVALVWNGNSWATSKLPAPNGQLTGLSCVSAGFCMAVGYNLNFNTSSSAIVSLSLLFNGSSWVQQTFPSSSGQPMDVSCASVTFCMAIGINLNATTFAMSTIAASFNGATWTSITVPSSVGSLYAVSCTDSNVQPAISCMLSGATQGTQTGSATPEALTYAAGQWTTETLPQGVNSLQALSCVSAVDCTALGTTNTQYIILSNASTMPAITSITPDSSPVSGGGTAYINGLNFSSGATVSFGSQELTGAAVTVNSATSIAVTIPSTTSPGVVQVSVDTSNGESNSSGFVYINNSMPYTPLSPYRIVDTRCSVTPKPAYCSQENLPAANASLSTPAAGGYITVQVSGTGVSGDSVPGNAQAIVATVTAVAAANSQNGYLSVYPAGTSAPTASTLNYAPGEAVPNLVTVAIGSGGQVDILASSAHVNVIVDVEGYYAPDSGSNVAGGYLSSLPDPVRIADTRCSASPPPSYCLSEGIPSANAGLQPLQGGATVKIVVAGVDQVPVTAMAVSLVVTAASPQSSGYLTVWPDGAQKQITSNVNFHSGPASADGVIVPVGQGGQVDIYNGSESTVDVVVDVNGWFSGSSTGISGSMAFTPSAPVRICDTRSIASIGGVGDVSEGVIGQCANSGTQVIPAAPLTIQVTGVAGGLITADAGVVVMNVTVAGADNNGYLTVWPAGTLQPATSNVSYKKGVATSDMVTCRLNAQGQVEVYSLAAANVIVDVAGWYQ